MINKMQLCFVYLYPIISKCFGRSSRALDCIYSLLYSSPILLPAGVMDEMEPIPSRP